MAYTSASDTWLNACSALAVTRDPSPPASTSPLDGTPLHYPRLPVVDINSARSRQWAQTPLRDRQRGLSRFASVLKDHASTLSMALCLESGNPLGQCLRLIDAAIEHFSAAATVLQWPATTDSSDWVPRRHVDVIGHPSQSLADDTARLASALTCGCTCRWQAPTGRHAVARLFLHLWHSCQETAMSALHTWTVTRPGTNLDGLPTRTQVWIAPSAPIEQAVDDIVSGLCWHLGEGAHSVRNVMVDHALMWEMEQRLTAAIKNMAHLDARDNNSMWPAHLPRPVLKIAPTSGAERPPGPELTLNLMAISELPPLDHDLAALSIYSYDYREIDYVKRMSAGRSTQLCVNCQPFDDLSMNAQAWHEWLQPRIRKTRVEAPW